MRAKVFVSAIIMIAVWAIAGCQSAQVSSTPVFTDVPTLKPTDVPTPTPTATPIPFSELNLEDVLIQQGDLPPGVAGSQIRSHPPAMFNGIVKPDYEIYQLFEQNGEQVGGVAVFVYEDMNKVKEAYEFILEGMGGPSGTEPASLGDESAMVSIIGMTDLVWRHCHSVVHVRMGDTPESAVAYGERLMERLSGVVCRQQGENSNR